MSFKVKFTPYFEHSLKKIAKKHRSIKEDISMLVKQLEQEPKTGVEIRTNLYKIRLNISGSNKGKLEVPELSRTFLLQMRLFF